jgi:hypothetical protein
MGLSEEFDWEHNVFRREITLEVSFIPCALNNSGANMLRLALFLREFTYYLNKVSKCYKNKLFGAKIPQILMIV